MQTAPLPRQSLNGLVVNRHADLKLTHQATRGLALSAGLKFDERDNQSPSNTYGPMNSVAGDTFGTVVNAPVSNRKTRLELAGNYRIDRRQSARLAYEYEAVRRWCNNALANNAQSTDPEGFPADYYTRAACVQVSDNRESRVVAGYRLRASDKVRLSAAYTHARRSADVNSSYYNPMQASGEGFQNYGFVGYFDAARTEQIAKATLNWQPVESFDLGIALRYIHDRYDSALGVQSARTSSVDVDAGYTPTENLSLSAYLTLQRRKRDMLAAYDRSPTAPPTQIWSNRLGDDSDTIGLAARRSGLLQGKLQAVLDASYSSGKSDYSVGLVSFASDLCSATLDLTCGQLPAFKNDVTRLRLSVSYQASSQGTVAAGYLYQKLSSNDYYYSAYQLGSTAVTVLPTNQRAPSYTMNVIALSYLYNFR